MENKELLLAMSDMMDKKLNSIHERMDTFDTKLDAVEERLSARIDALDAKIDSVEIKLSARIDALDAKIDSVESKLTAEISAVDERLSADIRTINLTLENVVVPRIKHIEQCYVSTSERYINEVGRINGMVADIQVMKSVVQDHSVQLQKIS